MLAGMPEVVIIGAGAAGLSLAWALGRRGVGDVVVVEREEQPGMHATGRSAASLVELDPSPVLTRLKIGGGAFLRAPPAGFAEGPLLDRAGILFLLDGSPDALVGDAASLGVPAEALAPAEAAARVPALVPGAFAGAVFLPDDGHIDVHALLDGYRRGAEHAGAALRRGETVTGFDFAAGRVRAVTTSSGARLEARWVVDAAGAWAGPIARLAGAAPIPVVPLRRTIATFATPAGFDATGWPLTIFDDRNLYFGPESGGLLVSPMDVTPSEPCDARADDVAIAAAFERMRAFAPALVPTALRRRWAGLRSFSPDGVLVVGEDPLVRGFFWLAAQGGCGIETSPFVAEIAADLLLEGRTERFDAKTISPLRFQEPVARSR